MEVVYKIIGVGIITAVSAITLRQTKPELALILSIVGGIVIFLLSVRGLSSVFSSITSLTERTGLDQKVFEALLKIVGVGYLTEIASGVCADSGSSSLANYVSLGGKIIILVLAMPIINNLVNLIISIL
ncbi:MAG: stage III sporulation protein AD [Christensenellaceae bacterium]|jgi:stage III sporulation protein AD|nr:stage III sporulation protein AD [Christensenellaceae bacterium]